MRRSLKKTCSLTMREWLWVAVRERSKGVRARNNTTRATTLMVDILTGKLPPITPADAGPAFWGKDYDEVCRQIAAGEPLHDPEDGAPLE